MSKKIYKNYTQALIAVASLLAFPLVSSNPYILSILIMANIYSINAMAWNFSAIVAGQMNLGQALFMGIAAYTSALLFKYLNFGPWMCLPIALLAALACAFALGLPSIRVRGPYLLIITFAICQIAMLSFARGGGITGGEEGLSGMYRIVNDPIFNYFISLILMVFAAISLRKILNSRLGLSLRSIADDEVAAETMGVNPTRSKLLAFIIASLLGGLSGWFYAFYQQSVNPSLFSIQENFLMLMGTVIGGPGTIAGPITGSYFIAITTEYLRPLGYYRLLVYSALMVLIPLFLPGGLYSQWVKIAKGISGLITRKSESTSISPRQAEKLKK